MFDFRKRCCNSAARFEVRFPEFDIIVVAKIGGILKNDFKTQIGNSDFSTKIMHRF